MKGRHICNLKECIHDMFISDKVNDLLHTLDKL
jgi:hypothetical protein